MPIQQLADPANLSCERYLLGHEAAKHLRRMTLPSPLVDLDACVLAHSSNLAIACTPRFLLALLATAQDLLAQQDLEPSNRLKLTIRIEAKG